MSGSKNWPKQRQIASLFPMKDGKPNPDYEALEKRIPGVQEHLALQERGLAPCVWVATKLMLLAYRVPTEEHPNVFTRMGNAGQNPAMTGEIATWGPRWAVLVVEADPCNEQAKHQALERAMRDSEFRDALDTISRLAEKQARRKMADYLMEMWEPEDGP